MKKYRIQLDISTWCNLNCPACGMRKINYGKIGAGFLTFKNFKKFIDKNKDLISSIEISNSGEPLLNPEAPQIIKYAYENNIDITIKNGTNFTKVSDELIKALVDYQVKIVYVAIDGASQEVYSRYRRGGDFNIVIDNLKKLITYKKEKNSTYPEIVWQYIVMQTDDDPKEIQKALTLANKLGIKIEFKLTWELDYVPSNPDKIKELTGLQWLNRKQLPKEHNHSKFHKCKTTYFDEKIVINWNGLWLICCGNKIPTNINVFDIGLEGLFNSLEYMRTKEILNGEIVDQSHPCFNCGILSRKFEELKEFLDQCKLHYKSDSWKRDE